MGEKVVSLAAAREAREECKPHLVGEAKCLACGHRWEAVAPVGLTSALQCPECDLMRGAYVGGLAPRGGYVWRCDCGNDTFNLTPDGAFCLGCAVIRDGW